jgi:tripartite-type tricarboxylate transporter receptor subunit TctC
MHQRDLDTRMRRRILKALLAAPAAAAFGPSLAQSQDYPNRPVKLVMPYAAGGAPELFIRPMQQVLSPRLGQQLIIEYRPGANSQIGTAYVAKAPADGYTVLFISDAAMSIAPALHDNLQYDAEADFVPVTILNHLPFLVVANPKAGISNVQELLAKARAKPGTVSYGSLGIASSAHVAMEMFAQQQGIELLHVPYQGTGPGVTALLGGEIDLLFASIGPSLPHVRAGRLRAVAVTSRNRSSVVPDVPTFIESGLDFEVAGWFGIMAHRGTPANILQRLRQEFWTYVSSPDFREGVVLKNGYEPTAIAPDQAEAFLKENRTKWASWVKKVEPRLRRTS